LRQRRFLRVITLRAATSDDIDAVLAFWTEATAEPSSTDDADGIAGLLERAPGALVVAVDGGTIVGSVIAGWDGWRGTIYRLAVAPAHRRRGIATRLVNQAEGQLRRHGVRRMHLIVSRAGGDAAESFWIAARYEPTDQVRMVKDLA
jgi:ribosomal protein S18 acetylase RimI-like enzyme